MECSIGIPTNLLCSFRFCIQADRAQNEFDGRAVPTSQGELIQRSSNPLTEFMEKRDVERGLEEKAIKDRKGNGERKGRDGK